MSGSMDDGRFGPAGRGDLRGRAAKGTLINAAFLVALNALGFIKGFAVAAFLSVGDYGIWGLLIVSFSTLLALVQVGVDDKYIQQDAPDQEAAFQLAFTLQCALCAIFVGLILAGLPLFALAYGDSAILAPGYVLALAMPAMALQAPLWTFYRRMDYLQQRKLQAFDPVVSFVVTIALAAAGLGVWALVLGVIAGSWSAAIAAMRASPYALRFRYERGTLREYARFSAPLFFSSTSGVLIAQIPALIAQRTLGLGGVGAMAVANNISAYANRVDDVVTNTLYPAICAVKDRLDLLEESFMKSNRLALLWAMPTGVGIVLFAPDLVEYVLGTRWHVATYAIQAFGLTAAINQIGFNWTAFYRAIGDTRPIAVATVTLFVSVMVIAVPLLITHDVSGFATGMGISIAIFVAVRLVYLRRLFDLRGIVLNTARGIAPTLPALAAAVALRAVLWGGERTIDQAIAEVVLYVLVAAGATVWSERALLREFRGYLRREPLAA